jgi:hypothetical protein
MNKIRKELAAAKYSRKGSKYVYLQKDESIPLLCILLTCEAQSWTVNKDT